MGLKLPTKEETEYPPENKLTATEYVKEGGVRCLRCKSEDIEGSSFQSDSYGAFQPITCNNCGYDWLDLYKLVGIYDTKTDTEHLAEGTK